MPEPKGTVVAEWEDGGVSYLSLAFPMPDNAPDSYDEKGKKLPKPANAMVEFVADLPADTFKIVDGERKALTKAERKKALTEIATARFKRQFNL